MRVRALCVPVAVLVVGACRTSMPREEPFVPPPGVTAVGEMEATLRAAVTAQRAFRQARGTYAATADELIAAGGLQPRPGVTLVVLRASDQGWAGRAEYAAASGRNCVVFDGSVPGGGPLMTDGEGLEPTVAGVPVCDPPAEPSQ